MTEVRMRLGLRMQDLDSLGHVNQAVYHGFLEEARTELFRPLIDEARGLSFVLARVELDHRHEILHTDGHVEVIARLEELGTKSAICSHQILLPDGTVAAEGRSVVVAWDMNARRARPLTAGEREVLAGRTAA
jgi:acyl-CoA thioester hydrolase